MTKQKKPKTGDVVGWVVIDNEGDVRSDPYHETRKSARKDAKEFARWSKWAPYRIAKIVLAK